MKVNSPTKVTNLNADKLDGQDSTQFLHGPGAAIEVARSFPADNNFIGTVLEYQSQSPRIIIYYFCPDPLSNNGFLRIRNLGAETINVFSDNGLDTPNTYEQLIPNEQYTQTAAAIGEHITLQAQGAGVATIEVFSVHRTSSLGTGTENNCHVQAQGLWANSP